MARVSDGSFMSLLESPNKAGIRWRERQVLNCSGNDGGGVTGKLLRIATGRVAAALDWWQTTHSFNKYFFIYD